jgi:hypothetical protein
MIKHPPLTMVQVLGLALILTSNVTQSVSGALITTIHCGAAAGVSRHTGGGPGL